MKFKIYQLAEPEILEIINKSGYELGVNQLMALEDFHNYDLDNSYDSFESAKEAIEKNAKNLKHKTLIVLPVFNISYNGEIE